MEFLTKSLVKYSENDEVVKDLIGKYVQNLDIAKFGQDANILNETFKAAVLPKIDGLKDSVSTLIIQIGLPVGIMFMVLCWRDVSILLKFIVVVFVVMQIIIVTTQQTVKISLR